METQKPSEKWCENFDEDSGPSKRVIYTFTVE
jgi:hypothetical protein